ncbi:HTH_Tnp_Tc3_2 domain-containing protein [Trichonephila clavipes]|nr:HTH_Tnp_Tc3_2 domain-containing protein [Trichonephila clavipes]
MKNQSHASRIPSIDQSPPCHSAEKIKSTFAMPNIADYPDMGLMTVFTVRMPKTPSITGKIVGAQRMGHSIYEMVRQGFLRSTVSRVYQEYMEGGQKTSNRANCKGHLALTVRGERWLRRIVRSRRSQT